MQRFLCIVMSVCVCPTVFAAALSEQTITPIQTTISLKPTITSLQYKTQSQGCIDAGASIAILGRNFATNQNRRVALSGNGAHIDTTIRSWQGTRIDSRLPNDTRLKAGASFFIAIEKADHSVWLSNTNQTIIICQNASTSNPTNSLVNNDPTGAAVPNNPTVGAPSDNTDPLLPLSSGSLLDSSLPPVPEDLTPLTPKDDRDVEPGQLLLISRDISHAKTMAQQASGLGFRVLRRRRLKGLGLVVSVLQIPQGMTVSKALKTLRQAMPQTWIDANHRYRLMGAGKNRNKHHYGSDLIQWGPAPPDCGKGMKLGIIDSAIASSHPALKGQRITQKSFLTPGIKAASADHGTAIATLLVGHPRHATYQGLLPGTQLYVANVFRQHGKRDVDTTAEWIVYALDWLVQQDVPVINMSLGGARNLLLEAAVTRALKSGTVIVAAAGNNGRKAPAVYPAAQPGVIAVTAIDARLKPYRKANRGAYIDFAAPGVDLWSAKADGSGAYVSGTSYAAPFVSAALLATKKRQPKTAWPNLQKHLQQQAHDLGKPKRDEVYGWGLVQVVRACQRQ